MDNQPKGCLPIGRAAFAKAFCSDWISEHSKKILSSFVVLIGLSFCLSQIIGKFSTRGKSDYLEAQNAFRAWVSSETLNPKIPVALSKPLSRHPELKTKFGAHIAQRLLAFGEAKHSEQYAAASLKRSHDLKTPYYDRFSQNSLAIVQGKYPEALEEAKRLKSDLEQDDAFWDSRDKFIRSGVILYAYNLVRIASLEKELGSKEGELVAWDDLIRNSGWKEPPHNQKMYDPEAYAHLAQNFTQGDVSLLDYIEQRRKELTQ